MVFTVVVGMLCAATPSPPAEPLPKLATLPLKTVGVSGELATFYGEHLAQQLRAQGFSVVTPQDVAALLGMERQKQLLGCSEDASSCLAELANAMGAAFLLDGEVAKLDQSFHVNLKVLDAQLGETVAWYSGEAGNERALLDRLKEGAQELSTTVLQRLGRAPVAKEAPARPLRRWSWAPLLAGAAFAGGGGWLLAQAQGNADQLTAEPTDVPLANPDAIRSQGELQQNLARGAFALAAAGVIAAGTMYLWPATSSGPAATVLVTPSGGGVALFGVWP